MRQKVEIEVDPAPAGYRYTGEYRRVAPGEHYAYEGESHKCYGERGCYLILEKVEPKRESRWLNVFHDNATDCPWVGIVFQTRNSSDSSARYTKSIRKGCIRLDYEDGKLVAVTLEPEGEVRDAR